MWSGSAHTAVAHGTTVAMASAKSVVFVRMHGRGSFQPSTCQKHQKTRMYLWRSMKWWKIWIPSSTSQVWQWQLFISNLATPRRQEHQLKIFSRFWRDWIEWIETSFLVIFKLGLLQMSLSDKWTNSSFFLWDSPYNFCLEDLLVSQMPGLSSPWEPKRHGYRSDHHQRQRFAQRRWWLADWKIRSVLHLFFGKNAMAAISMPPSHSAFEK